jgi:hypothetical protein
MVYAGAFRLPEMVRVGGSNGEGNAYNTALAFDDATGHLFFGQLVGAGGVGAISIPALQEVPTTFSGLPTGTQQQAPADADEGVLNPYCDGFTSGLLVDGSNLIASRNVSYPGTLPEYTTVYRPKNLASAGGLQPKQFSVNGDTVTFRRYVGGYMCHVPPEWQAALGGDAIAGFIGNSINTSTSVGPAAFVFNKSVIASSNTVAVQPLCYYRMGLVGDPTNRRLSNLDFPPISQAERATIADGLWNDTARIEGCMIPNGTRSLLFWGWIGYGPYDYGTAAGGTGPAEGEGYPPARRAAGLSPDRPIYDVIDVGSPGERAYPYRYQVWAYDLNDLAAVRAETIQPWEARPYATWTFSLPFEGTSSTIYNKSNPDPNPDGHYLQGACYDKATKRAYVLQIRGPNGRSAVHAFTINNATAV